MTKKLKMTRPATVQKIIPRSFAEPEKAEIRVEGADHLYREIRIENQVDDGHGHKAKLKAGAEVEVTVAADADATIPAKDEKEASKKSREDDSRQQASS